MGRRNKQVVNISYSVTENCKMTKEWPLPFTGFFSVMFRIRGRWPFQCQNRPLENGEIPGATISGAFSCKITDLVFIVPSTLQRFNMFAR